ncbi:MAG: hypothetical protein ACHREM_09575 [Polyangiales bacterium]
MRTTIHYAVYSERELRQDEWKEICAAQAVVNHRCTWTSGDLSLERLDPRGREASSLTLVGKAKAVAWGQTKVDEDEWNTVLVIAFLDWLTTRYPHMTVQIRFDGPFGLGTARLLGGRDVQPERRPTDNVECPSSRPRAIGEHADDERIFALISIDNYRDRREVVALGLSDAELRSLTVVDVVKRLPIPWFDTNASAT